MQHSVMHMWADPSAAAARDLFAVLLYPRHEDIYNNNNINCHRGSDR
jgi:hypothetical protein